MELLHLLLTIAACRMASAVSSDYAGSSYTSMTVTTERYACSGELTGGNSATKIAQHVLGDRSCSGQASYFACSVTGSKVGRFACDSSDTNESSPIEEYAVGGCFACADYAFPCARIWWKGTYYDGKYFKPVCNSYSPGLNSGQSPGCRIWTAVVVVLISMVCC
ncbi:unnamed protein product [Symbiodinium natans]|uniref:Secreted protein n=1 Tax=Symbiodinium natans TaxID=878477 RepID=A0A812NFL7_9DINO|nr:unnamed protein product [Symbiodinium natans]